MSGSQRLQKINHLYMQALNCQADIIDVMLSVFCNTKEYERRKALFKTACISGDLRGPLLGCATNYKIGLNTHLDSGDDGWCATFVAGRFSGGAMYFPQLGRAFK
jgi:hypothetical protein